MLLGLNEKNMDRKSPPIGLTLSRLGKGVFMAPPLLFYALVNFLHIFLSKNTIDRSKFSGDRIKEGKNRTKRSAIDLNRMATFNVCVRCYYLSNG